jgi:hypothetical protein
MVQKGIQRCMQAMYSRLSWSRRFQQLGLVTNSMHRALRSINPTLAFSSFSDCGDYKLMGFNHPRKQ